MINVINRLKLVFLAVFAVATVAVFTYHIVWVWPRDACEAKGDWWDWRGRACAHPVVISDITGRPIKEKRDAEKAEAAARQAASPKPR